MYVVYVSVYLYVYVYVYLYIYVHQSFWYVLKYEPNWLNIG